MNQSASRLSRLCRLRSELIGRIAEIGDMRRGSVVRQFIKRNRGGLGKPRLWGPYVLYTCKRKGKTIGRRLRRPDEIRRLEKRVENYHLFRRLCTELVDVSEKICEETDREREGHSPPASSAAVIDRMAPGLKK